MFLMVAGEDQDVVQVDKDSPVEEITKHIVNKCLEDGRGTGKTERHHEVL